MRAFRRIMTQWKQELSFPRDFTSKPLMIWLSLNRTTFVENMFLASAYIFLSKVIFIWPLDALILVVMLLSLECPYVLLHLFGWFTAVLLVGLDFSNGQLEFPWSNVYLLYTNAKFTIGEKPSTTGEIPVTLNSSITFLLVIAFRSALLHHSAWDVAGGFCSRMNHTLSSPTLLKAVIHFSLQGVIFKLWVRIGKSLTPFSCKISNTWAEKWQTWLWIKTRQG